MGETTIGIGLKGTADLGDVTGGLQRVAELMRSVGIHTSSTREEMDKAIRSLRELRDAAPESERRAYDWATHEALYQRDFAPRIPPSVPGRPAGGSSPEGAPPPPPPPQLPPSASSAPSPYDPSRRYSPGEQYVDVDGTVMVMTTRGPRVVGGGGGGDDPTGASGGGRPQRGSMAQLQQMVVGAMTYEAYGRVLGMIDEGRGIARDVGELSYGLGVPGVRPAGVDVDAWGKGLGDRGAAFGYSRRESLRGMTAYQRRLGLSSAEFGGDVQEMMGFSRRYGEELDDLAGFTGGVRQQGGIAEGKTQEFIRALGEGIERAQAQGRAADFREGFRTLSGAMTARLPQLTQEQTYGAIAAQEMLDLTGVRGWMGSTGAQRWNRMFSFSADTPEDRQRLGYLFGFTPGSTDPMAAMVETQQFAAGLPGNLDAQRKYFETTLNRERGAMQGMDAETQYRHLAGVFQVQSGGRISGSELVPLLKQLMPADKDGQLSVKIDPSAINDLARAVTVGPSAVQNDSYAASQRRYQQMYERDREWMGRISGRMHSGMADFFGTTLVGDSIMGLAGIGGQWGAGAAGAAAGGWAQSALGNAVSTGTGVAGSLWLMRLLGMGGAAAAGGAGAAGAGAGVGAGAGASAAGAGAAAGGVSMAAVLAARFAALGSGAGAVASSPFVLVPAVGAAAFGTGYYAGKKIVEHYDEKSMPRADDDGNVAPRSDENWSSRAFRDEMKGNKLSGVGAVASYENDDAVAMKEKEYQQWLQDTYGLKGDDLQREMQRYHDSRRHAFDYAKRGAQMDDPKWRAAEGLPEMSARMRANIQSLDQMDKGERARASRRLAGKLKIEVTINGGTEQAKADVAKAVSEGVRQAATSVIDAAAEDEYPERAGDSFGGVDA